MATTPAISQARKTVAGVLAGATLATGAIMAGVAVTSQQATTTAADNTVSTASSDDDQVTSPTTSTVTNPGTTNRAPQTSTRGS